MSEHNTSVDLDREIVETALPFPRAPPPTGDSGATTPATELAPPSWPPPRPLSPPSGVWRRRPAAVPKKGACPRFPPTPSLLLLHHPLHLRRRTAAAGRIRTFRGRIFRLVAPRPSARPSSSAAGGIRPGSRGGTGYAHMAPALGRSSRQSSSGLCWGPAAAGRGVAGPPRLRSLPVLHRYLPWWIRRFQWMAGQIRGPQGRIWPILPWVRGGRSGCCGWPSVRWPR